MLHLNPIIRRCWRDWVKMIGHFDGAIIMTGLDHKTGTEIATVPASVTQGVITSMAWIGVSCHVPILLPGSMAVCSSQSFHVEDP